MTRMDLLRTLGTNVTRRASATTTYSIVAMAMPMMVTIAHPLVRGGGVTGSGGDVLPTLEAMHASSRIRVGGTLAAAVIVVLALALAGCGSSDESVADTRTAATSAPAVTRSAVQQHPDVIDVVAEQESAGVFSFAVTISSPYDTPDRYADGWRIVGPDGTVYGEHTLAHDHANEQPFTRTQRGVAIPPGVDEVTVEGRDLEYGYGGGTVTVSIDR